METNALTNLAQDIGLTLQILRWLMIIISIQIIATLLKGVWKRD